MAEAVVIILPVVRVERPRRPQGVDLARQKMPPAVDAGKIVPLRRRRPEHEEEDDNG